MKKRIIRFILTTIMVLTLTGSVYANDNSLEFASNASNETIDNSLEIYRMEGVRGFIEPPYGSATLEVPLSPYIGLTKKIFINAVSETTQGILFVYLYKPNGEIASHDWVMDPNEIRTWSLTLPSSGTWKLHIVAGNTNEPVEIFAKWE